MMKPLPASCPGGLRGGGAGGGDSLAGDFQPGVPALSPGGHGDVRAAGPGGGRGLRPGAGAGGAGVPGERRRAGERAPGGGGLSGAAGGGAGDPGAGFTPGRETLRIGKRGWRKTREARLEPRTAIAKAIAPDLWSAVWAD
jgi:translation initiation factor IF-2